MIIRDPDNMETMNELTDEERECLRSYLWNDSGGGDLTSCLFGTEEGSASIYVEEECMVSGLEAAAFLFEEEGCGVEINTGEFADPLCRAGAEVMRITGPFVSLLKVERVALNILSRMSGIATIAHRAAEMAESISPCTRVAGTRKTTPGFHLMEKRALMDGGALPHRKDLSSLAMIKDNHLEFLGGGPDAVLSGLEILRDLHGPYVLLEVEVEDIPQALAALEGGADIIMLDNMSPELCEKAAGEIRAAMSDLCREVTIEASGGISLEDIPDYAPHVDVISMGSLTQGSNPVGFRMDHTGLVETVDA